MARTDSTKTFWRVQVRRAYNLKWQNTGLFETRKAARARAVDMRYAHDTVCDVRRNEIGRAVAFEYKSKPGYGFGNTRVVKHIRGEKK